MVDTYEEANELAEALEDEGFDVVDTLVGRGGQPSSVVVGVEDLRIAGTAFDEAELVVDVRKTGPAVSSVQLYDEPDHRLSDEQASLLDDVCDERYPDPELTLWEYDPGSASDNVETFLAEISAVYEDRVG